eukprot:2533976-Alexandrium_andersonii.AAC.1
MGRVARAACCPHQLNSDLAPETSYIVASIARGGRRSCDGSTLVERRPAHGLRRKDKRDGRRTSL